MEVLKFHGLPITSIVSPPVLLHGDGVEDLVKELEGTVEVDLDPARRLLDRLSVVVRAPPLDEAQPEDAEPAEVVDADAGGGGEGDGGGEGAGDGTAVGVARHGGGLGGGGGVGRVGLLLHLPVALSEVEHLEQNKKIVSYL